MLKKKRLGKFIRLFLTVLTLCLFVYYFANNKSEFSRLQDLSIFSIALILIGQLTVLASNVFILIFLMRIANKKISFVTSSRVIAYSSLINFFGFLQGGLGFRGFYLNRYYKLSLKDYTLLTILQYLCVFGISFIMICAGLWWINYSFIPILVLAFSLIILFVFKNKIFKLLTKTRLYKLPELITKHGVAIGVLLALSLIQFFGSALAYGVELHVVGAHFSLGALLIFTGVAQFAILIALTPGAIGIRESLLFLVQGIMAISTASIILAGTIDRVIYFLLLLIITPFAIGFKKNLDTNKIAKQDS